MRLLVNRLILNLLLCIGVGRCRVCAGLAQRGMRCEEKCNEQQKVFHRSPPRDELRRLVSVSASSFGVAENVNAAHPCKWKTWQMARHSRQAPQLQKGQTSTDWIDRARIRSARALLYCVCAAVELNRSRLSTLERFENENHAFLWRDGPQWDFKWHFR
jgi:hypothetical protein